MPTAPRHKLPTASPHQISRHPTISKGVRNINITVGFCKPSLVDFLLFCAFFADRVDDELELYQDYYRYGSPEYWNDGKIPEETKVEIQVTARLMVARLRRFGEVASGASTNDWKCEASEEVIKQRARVLRIHRQYVELVKTRESLLSSRAFYRAFSSSLKRMPHAKHFNLLDKNLDKTFWRIRGTVVLRDATSSQQIWPNLFRYMLNPYVYHCRALSSHSDHMQENGAGVSGLPMRCSVDRRFPRGR